MTGRGAGLLLGAAAVLAAGARVGALVVVGAVALAIGVVAIVLDAARAPGREDLRATRRHPERVSLATPAEVVVEVAAQDGRASLAVVRDEVAPTLDVVQGGRTVEAPFASGPLPVTLVYSVLPQRRGRQTFGGVAVRTLGPWRLGFRQVVLRTPTTLVVDPDLRLLRAADVLGRRGRLADIGIRVRRSPGEGTEFERVREAVPDDPMRIVNWKATARTGRLMATELAPERAQTLVLCLDCGRLMGVGDGRQTKLDQALAAVCLVAHVALRQGDRVGFVAFADRVLGIVPPRSGRGQLRAILDLCVPLESADVDADYAAALDFVSRWQRRRALVVVVTDILDPGQGRALVGRSRRLQSRHLPMVATVRDPTLELAASLRPGATSEVYARAIATALLEERDALVAQLRRSGIESVDAPPSRLAVEMVNRYLDLKRRGRL